jgi:hypothetical protein
VTRASGRRPRRGSPHDIVPGDIRSIVLGDVGDYAPSSEERIHHNYEAITEPADIPGGKTHVVNPQTITTEANRGEARARRRPVDTHREHDVPPENWARDYEVPRTLVHKDLHPQRGRLEPVPVTHDAVPVYIVQEADAAHRIRALVTEGPVTMSATALTEPMHLADRDPQRVKLWICNETTPGAAGSTGPGVRIGEYATVADGRGLLVPAGQLKDFNSQDEIYLNNFSGTAVTISWGFETEIPVSTSGT